MGEMFEDTAEQINDLNACKKEFETWAKLHKFNVGKDKDVVHQGQPIYASPMTQGAYMAWCAARDGR